MRNPATDDAMASEPEDRADEAADAPETATAEAAGPEDARDPDETSAERVIPPMNNIGNVR